MTPDIVARNRAAMLPLHGWLGLIAATLIYLIAFTGTLCVFDGEIDRLARPATRLSIPAPLTANVVQRVTRSADASRGWIISPPSAHRDVGRATMFGATGNQALFFDPSNGRLIQTPAGPMAYLLALHSRLTIRAWNIGYILVTASGLALIALLITGLFLYPRLIADLFTLRIGPPLATLATVHRLTGVFGLPFNMVVALGGLLMLLPILADRPINSLYSDEPGGFQSEIGASCVAPLASAATREIPLASILKQTRAAWPDATPGRLTYDARANTLAIEPARGDGVSFGRDRLCFDASSGSLLEATQAGGPSQQIEQLLTGIHLAQYDRLALRLIHLVSGLLLCGLIATGLLLWSESRRRSKPVRRGAELVERWAVGLALGLPVATLVYLCADRFLLDSRFATQSFFWSSGIACMLATLILGRKSYQPLLVLASCLAGVAAIADHIAVTMPSGVDIALLFVAVVGTGLAKSIHTPSEQAVGR